MPTGLAKAALNRGIDVFAGYGMSETCPILTLAQVKSDAAQRQGDKSVNLRVKAGLPIPLSTCASSTTT